MSQPLMFPRCTKLLQAAGGAYPRTCAECGLGPCKRTQPEHYLKYGPLPQETKPSAPIDISKIKPGDRVKAEFVVGHVGTIHICGSVDDAEPFRTAVLHEHITEYIPKPREIAEGDQVDLYDGDFKVRCNVIAISDGEAWCRSAVSRRHYTRLLSGLTLIPSEAP